MTEVSDVKKQGVSLVLSSGGARGVAHIAVIEELERRGYQINSIAGSSIGAVIGGVYACGSLQDYKDWVCGLSKFDVWRLLDFSLSTQGFIRGERVFRAMEEFINDCKIEDLPINYAAVATDLYNKREYVFRQGSLFEAMRASVAIPTVMQPVDYKGLTLVDGGVLNPMPINCVKRNPDDLLVVVNVSAAIPCEDIKLPQMTTPDKKEEVTSEEEEASNYFGQQFEQVKQKLMSLFPSTEDQQEIKKETRKKLGFLDLMSESIDLMQDRITSLVLEDYRPDLTINISKDAASTFEFHRADELLYRGRKALNEALEAKEKTAQAS